MTDESRDSFNEAVAPPPRIFHMADYLLFDVIVCSLLNTSNIL